MTWLADVLRIVCIPAAVITTAVSLKVSIAGTYRDHGQLFRFLGLIVLNISVAFGDYEGLGHPPRSWTALVGSTLGILLAFVGTAVLWVRSRQAETSDSSVHQPR